MIDTKQMKKDLQKLAKVLRGNKETWCQCSMTEKQIANKTCTLNFQEEKNGNEVYDIIHLPEFAAFTDKYGEPLVIVERNSRNQTMIRFSW